MRSYTLDADFWLDYCQRIFSPEIAPPAVDATNNLYGGLEITGKNIYFLTASEDPWQFAGMKSIQDPDTQSEMKAWHIECEDCGHCIDLKQYDINDPEDLNNAVTDVWTTIYNWLCEDAEERGISTSYEYLFSQE